jgi:hypothetical protein
MSDDGEISPSSVDRFMTALGAKPDVLISKDRKGPIMSRS